MNIEKITVSKYDSRRGFSRHEYSYWTTGEVYKVYLDNGEIILLGWYNFDHTVIVTKEKAQEIIDLYN